LVPLAVRDLPSALAEVELRRAPPQWMFKKLLAALAAQIEAADLVRIGNRQLAVCVKLFKTFQNLVDIFQVIAVVIDHCIGLDSRRVHFHSYYIARVVLGIELALAHIATVVNHRKLILS
jgi:hypothetical protein